VERPGLYPFRALPALLFKGAAKSIFRSVSRLLKNYFGVRRLVAAFKSGQSEFQKPEENSSCVHSGDKSPHSKLAMRLSRAEFFSTLLSPSGAIISQIGWWEHE